MRLLHATIRAGTALAVLLFISACGGGGGSGSGASGSAGTPPPGGGTGSGSNPPPATIPVQINVGDGPADRLAAASLSITGMTITDAAGTTHTVLASSTPIEMMSLMGTVRPVSLTTLPQGTYRSMTVSFGSGTVLYLAPASHQLLQRTVAGPMTATVQFSPNLVVGSTPSVINLDMDMANSIAIDAAGGVTLTPVMNVRVNPAQSASSDPMYGGLDHVTGSIGMMGGDSFHLTTMQGDTNLPITVNADTHFMGMSDFSMMHAGEAVRVDATMHPDGTLVATRIEYMLDDMNHSMGMGIATALSGTPLSQVTLALHDGIGNGMMASYFGGTVTVTLSGTTAFRIDTDHVDLSNLPFTPTFDATTITKGQWVSIISDGDMMHDHMGGGMMGGASAGVQAIYLEQQGLRGTVSGYAANGTQSTFTLTIPSDSVFAQLAGTTTIAVYHQPGTELRGLSAITAGDIVRVRGLVFADGTGYRLVASRILGP